MRVLLSLALAGTMLCGPSQAETPRPRLLHPNAIPAQMEQCKAQPEVVWCITREDTRARVMWRGKDDPPDHDEWRSSANSVLVDHAFADDCDGLAMTTIDLLTRNNYPIGDLFLVLVSTTGGQFSDHMVGAARGADGRLWVVGDAMAPGAYPLSEMKWRLVAFMPVEIGMWVVHGALK